MTFMEKYNTWLNDPLIDENTKKELLALKDDPKEIEERFYKDLEFGTAGLRGKLGAGTNRMNVYNIAKVTQGISDYIVEKGQDYMDRGIAIAYDVRHFSKEFSKTAALVYAANGIKVYLFEDIRPTPELSFTIRKLKTAAGVVVTASHNPKDYNGYKVYWEEAAQVRDDIADGMYEKIKLIDSLEKVKKIDEKEAIEKGLLVYLGKDIDDDYIERVKRLSIRDDVDKDVRVIYTPLNGTGNVPVRRVLAERGFNNIMVVPEQVDPDPDFTTVGYPNPEDTKAFEYSIRLGKEKNADILLATDPDCDRLAVMVRDRNGEYAALNGNQTGALLINYIVTGLKEKHRLPENGAIIKSIVTGELGKAIGKKYGVVTLEALTGFKNICGVENEIEKSGEYKFLFGYEESIGYVTGDFVRDKDGVISSMLICEMAGYYKLHGKTLLDELNALYEEFGYYLENNFSIVLEGIEGQQKIAKMMEEYRKEYPKTIGNSKLTTYTDFRTSDVYDLVKDEKSVTAIPKSNVLKFYFDDESWYCVRPSGTEPKIKIYIYTKGKTFAEADEKLRVFETEIKNRLK